MSKTKKILWYLGILVVSLLLLLSFVSKNWLLAGVCALATAFLKSWNEKVEIPSFYRKKGITNKFFTDGGKYEKNTK